jgi:hypothetical protein
MIGTRAGTDPGDPLERKEWPHRATADVRRYFRRWIELRLADGSAIALLLGRSARMQIADAVSRVGPGGG